MKLTELNILHESFADFGFDVDNAGSADDPVRFFREHQNMGVNSQVDFGEFDEAKEYADDDNDSIIILEAATDAGLGQFVNLVMAQRMRPLKTKAYRVVDCDGNTVKDGMTLAMTKKFFETRLLVVERKSVNENVSFRYIVMNHDNAY